MAIKQEESHDVQVIALYPENSSSFNRYCNPGLNIVSSVRDIIAIFAAIGAPFVVDAVLSAWGVY